MKKNSSFVEEQYHQSSEEKQELLQKEYEITFQFYQHDLSNTWQIFSIVSTLAIAGLAFTGSIIVTSAGKVTWPVTGIVGVAMIIILLGWLGLANRWRTYMNIRLHRMEEIEKELGTVYMIRENEWFKYRLDKEKYHRLSDDEKMKYDFLTSKYPKKPTRILSSIALTNIIGTSLILIWIAFIMADILGIV